MQIRISLKSDTITPDLRKKIMSVKDPTPALREAGTVAAKMAVDAFTDPSLRPTTWPDIKDSTKKRKQSSAILIDSDTMHRSPRLIEAAPTHALVGSDRLAGSHSLAAIHQLGAPKAHIPPRPFFPFFASGEATETAKTRIREVIADWFNSVLKS